MVCWVGAAKSGTSLNIDKRCYEFEKESGGQFGKNQREERKEGNYVTIVYNYYIHYMQSQKSKK